MSETPGRINPIVAIAAVSVIIFSLVGVALMTGVIPSSLSENEQQAAKPAKQQAGKPAIKWQTAPESPQSSAREPVRTAAARVCAECGTVSAVHVIEKEGEGTGLGAVAGGVVGGVLGNQIGDGSGRRVATAAGAAGGAYAGHQIEKQVKKTTRWHVIVRMDDGSSRTFPFDAEPAFRAGDKVKVIDGRLAIG